MGGPKKPRVTSVSDYVAAQPASHRPAIEALRGLIRSVVPEATETTTYGIICFEHQNSPQHHAVALEAAGQARNVLALFEDQHPNDDRPRHALDAITDWATGKRTLGMAVVRKLSLASHSAAREATSDPARFAARAAGHAVATWHVPSHAEGAHIYAAKALRAIGPSYAPMTKPRRSR